jgi:hypothetical protein
MYSTDILTPTAITLAGRDYLATVTREEDTDVVVVDISSSDGDNIWLSSIVADAIATTFSYTSVSAKAACYATIYLVNQLAAHSISLTLENAVIAHITSKVDGPVSAEDILEIIEDALRPSRIVDYLTTAGELAGEMPR